VKRSSEATESTGVDPNRSAQLASRVERALGIDGEDDEVRVRARVGIRRAATPELASGRFGPRGIPRTDGHLHVGAVEARRERLAERPGPRRRWLFARDLQHGLRELSLGLRVDHPRRGAAVAPPACAASESSITSSSISSPYTPATCAGVVPAGHAGEHTGGRTGECLATCEWAHRDAPDLSLADRLADIADREDRPE
jgi:hypothetical protein